MESSHGHANHGRTKPPFAVFLAASVVIFFSSLSAADSIGLVPDYIDGTVPTPAPSVALSDLPQLGDDASTAATSTPDAKTIAALPERLIIPNIDLDLSIQNPSTTDINALDALLVNGPARYTDSAKLGENGTMIIFAHSSHLPIVHNQMFKAFNRIPELKSGDLITIQGGGKQYLYAVTDITKADVSDTKIDTSPALGTRLVLVTCDTLTGKSARYVLTANLVGSYDI